MGAFLMGCVYYEMMTMGSQCCPCRKYLLVNFEEKCVLFDLDRFEEMTCFFKKDLVPNIPL